MIKDAVRAEYREFWTAQGKAVLRGARVSCGEMTGVLVENDDVFVFGSGPEPIGRSEDVILALDAGSV